MKIFKDSVEVDNGATLQKWASIPSEDKLQVAERIIGSFEIDPTVVKYVLEMINTEDLTKKSILVKTFDEKFQ